MNPFYGGNAGQSFYIKAIFTSKNGNTNSIKADLGLGWSSPIGENEFVVISYGMPSDENFETYRDLDINSPDKKSYNSTLWQKCYDETQGNANGWYYKLIASMTGNTPKISIDQPIKVLNADEDPKVYMKSDDPDRPVLFFEIPQAQRIIASNVSYQVEDADYGLATDGSEPLVEFDDSSTTDKINKPTLKFRLPQSQVINIARIEEILDAGEAPEVRLYFPPKADGTPNVNAPEILFKLPQSQELLASNVSHQVLDANIMPYITFDTVTDKNQPRLIFYLPQAQVMRNPGSSVIDPLEDPSVTLDSSQINSPKLDFELPRAVRFYYGDLLGQRLDKTYTLTDSTFVDYGVGDYYINAKTGFVYLVKAKTGTTITFEFVACIQSPLPSVRTTSISPYKLKDDGSGEYEQNAPSVTKVYTNNELTEWELTFALPKAPKPAVSASFLGPLEIGAASVEMTDADTITFDFKIPTGSRMFAGELVGPGNYNVNIPEAKPGDLYLNGKTGNIYILNTAKIWEIQQGDLKGPVGDALHIVRDYRIQETATVIDSLDNGVDYILDHYKDSSGNPIPLKPDEIFAVTWITNDADKKETSYWYYYTEEGKWGRVQLTGGVNNLIKDDGYHPSGPTDDTDINNTTYSIRYINSLIGGKIDTGNMDKTAFSKDQIFGLLGWGTFADAITGIDVPEPENHDTLSAEEVIELMSWGSLAKLTLKP